jgi:DNA polymerase-3 subunit delta
VDELLAAIAAGRFDPIYVLASEHPVLVERVLAALRDAVVPPAARGFNYDVLEGKPTAARIVGLASTLPMMAARRLVYVRELAGLPAEDAEPLLAYLAKANPTTVIVAQTSKVDKRLKLYAGLGKKGWLHNLEAPRQLGGWLRAEAASRKVAIAPEAVNRLVDVIGADLSRLALALDQLAIFAGERPINSADVDELIATTRERSVFELTDAIGAGERVAALVAVASLCEQRESPVGVVAMLARYVRQLALVHVARATGVARGDLGAFIGVPPFVVDKLIAQARRYPAPTLARATARIAAADRALKGDATLAPPATGAMIKTLGRDLGERVLLEQLVDGIVAGAE